MSQIKTHRNSPSTWMIEYTSLRTNCALDFGQQQAAQVHMDTWKTTEHSIQFLRYQSLHHNTELHRGGPVLLFLLLLCICACACILVHILETESAKTSPMMLSKVTNPNQPLPNHWIPGGALAFFTLKPQDSRFMGLGTSIVNTFRGHRIWPWITDMEAQSHTCFDWAGCGGTHF